MNRFIKYCLAVAVALGFQVPAFAQASLEEVIVTAQRTEQSLQDVPIAVTALSSDDLATKQVITFSDLQLNVPGLNYGQTNFGAASINLRGVGRLSTGISFDQSIKKPKACAGSRAGMIPSSTDNSLNPSKAFRSVAE